MKTIIAVWHGGNKGKSQVIRNLANVLLSTYPTATQIFPILPSTISASGDFTLVLNVNGKIVGLESQGDPGTNLQGRLVNLCKTYNCYVIICSTRTRGETVSAVEHIRVSYGHEIIWTSTYQIDNPARHSVVNLLKANHIHELLVALRRI